MSTNKIGKAFLQGSGGSFFTAKGFLPALHLLKMVHRPKGCYGLRRFLFVRVAAPMSTV